MLEDLLFNSDGFDVVDGLLHHKRCPRGIKALSSSPLFPHSRFDNLNSLPALYITPTQISLETFEDMVLTRQLLREFQPFFRVFDDAAFAPIAASSRRGLDSWFSEPFGMGSGVGRPAQVELKEEGNQYVVEAELPGVKKEHLDVHIGDNGRSLTIEGKVVSRSPAPEHAQSDANTQNQTTSTEVTQSNQAAGEQWYIRSSFSRTIWLPRAVDASKVSGKLEDGVLRLTVPKMESPKEKHKITVD